MPTTSAATKPRPRPTTEPRDRLQPATRRAIQLLHEYGGEVREPSGRAVYLWLRTCENPWAAPAATQLAYELAERGVIDRELNGKRTFRISLNYLHPHVIRTLREAYVAGTIASTAPPEPAQAVAEAAMAPEPEGDVIEPHVPSWAQRAQHMQSAVATWVPAPETPTPNIIITDAFAFAQGLVQSLTGTQNGGAPPTEAEVTLDTATIATLRAQLGETERRLSKAGRELTAAKERIARLTTSEAASKARIEELQRQLSGLESNMKTIWFQLPRGIRDRKDLIDLARFMEELPHKDLTKVK
jgi:hypothetical protein